MTTCITGASAGIGAATAEAFARAGHRLLLCARRLEKLDALADRMREQHGADIHTFALDVRDAEAVEAAFAGLPDEWKDEHGPAVNVLVNNAGLSRALDPAYANRVRHIDDMVDTNVKGLLYVTRAVVPAMVARNSGHVVNVGSTAGHDTYPGGTVYCATKHAVGAITRGLKKDLHGTAVRVSTVDPGLVETDFSLVRFEGDADRAGAVYAATEPLRPEDVAEAILWAATRPPHVNVAQIILTPTAQSSVSMLTRREKN